MMQGHDSGWTWFDEAPEEVEGRAWPAGIPPDLLKSYMRTFCNEHGYQVIRHLRRITLERSLGPNASDSHLRHLEGQRQLVRLIMSITKLEGDSSGQRGVDDEKQK
jgi:hypothetical protein